jgi:hypothetical protein
LSPSGLRARTDDKRGEVPVEKEVTRIAVEEAAEPGQHPVKKRYEKAVLMTYGDLKELTGKPS